MSHEPDPDHPLLALVGDIYDCAIAPEKWPAALEKVTALLGGSFAAISLHDTRQSSVALKAQWNVEPAFEQSMAAHFAINPLVSAFYYYDVDQPVTAKGFLGEEAYLGSAWYRNAVAQHGLGDAIMTFLAKSNARFGALSLFRRDRASVFGAREVEALRMLAPHVRRAVMIADMLDARALERDMLSATLDQLAVGIVLTDDAGRIVHANSAAARHLDDASAMRREGSALGAHDPACARDLAQAIADAASGTTVDIPRTGIVVSLRGAAGRDLAAWVLPLDGGLRRDLGAAYTARVAVFVRDLGDTAPFPAELFVRHYAITPAECRVMMLLVQGMTIAEVAQTLGIALATARTHLARLFEKTGTSRQADLVRLAMSALAPVS